MEKIITSLDEGITLIQQSPVEMQGSLVLWIMQYCVYLDELYVSISMNDPEEELFWNSEKAKEFEGYDTELFYFESVKEV